MSYIVIARLDDALDGTKGKYTLATRTVFPTEEMAIAYTRPIQAVREPLVIPGDFANLRFDAEERFT